MLVLIYFTNCLVLSMTSQQPPHSISLALIAVQAIIFVGLLLKFVCNPDPFGFFRYSFTHEKCLAEWHYCLQIVFLPLAVALLSVPGMPFLSAVPCVLMLVYTLLRKPYKKNKDNYRSAFNLLVMCCLVGMKSFIFYWPEENKREMPVYLMLLGCLGLVFVVLLLGIVFAIHDYYTDLNAEEEARKNKTAAEIEE
jgi:hypothetical protein